MAQSNKYGILTAFNHGEYGAHMHGRVDYAGYKSSVRKLSNFIPKISGSIARLKGFEYIAPLDNYYNLVPIHNQQTELMLLLSPTNEAKLVVEKVIRDLGIYTGIANGFSFVQNYDTIVLCDGLRNPVTIKYTGDSVTPIEFSELKFDEVPYYPFGAADNYTGTLQANGYTGVITLSATPVGYLHLPLPNNFTGTWNPTGASIVTMRNWSKWIENATYTLGAFTITLKRNGVSLFNTSSIGTVSYHNGQMLSSPRLRVGVRNRTISVQQIIDWLTSNGIVSSFTNGKLLIDTSTIPGYNVSDTYQLVLDVAASTSNKNLNNYNSTTPQAGDPSRVEWTSGDRNGLNNFRTSYNGVPSIPSYTFNGDIGTGTITDVGADPNIVGRKIKFYMNNNTASQSVRVWYQGLTVTTGMVVLSDGHYYKAINAGTAGNVKPTHTSGIVSDSVIMWMYLHSGTATAKIVEIVNSSTLKCDLGGQYLPIIDFTTPINIDNYRWSMWGDKGQFPTNPFYYQNRLGFTFNTKLNGAYINLSCLNEFTNFSEETSGEVLATNAIQSLITGASKGYYATWVLSGERLVVGTIGAEIVFNKKADIISPDSFPQSVVSVVGGYPIMALKHYNKDLFVGIDDNSLYNVQYDFSSDSFTPENIGYVSEHLLKGLTRLSSETTKDKTVWINKNDGTLSLCTYYPIEKVIAFCDTNLPMSIYDTAISYSSDRNAVYLIALDEDLGYMLLRYDNDSNDGVCLFAKTTFNWDGLNFIESIDATYLQGKNLTVCYRRNGESEYEYVKLINISDYSNITIPVNDAVWVCVGLDMESEINTHPISGYLPEGSNQQIIKTSVRINKCGEFLYSSSNRPDEWINSDAGLRASDNSKYRTGDLDLSLPQGTSQFGNLCDGDYPNSSGTGVNIKFNSPRDGEILSIGIEYQ